MAAAKERRAIRMDEQRRAAAISEGQWLAEYRRQGGDMAFQWHLAGQRIRIVVAHLTKPLHRILAAGKGGRNAG